MKILEVLHLRMAGDDSDPLAALVRKTATEGDGLPEVRVYRHARVEGDLLIHIHRRGPHEGIEASELGIRLASVLRAHGMVEHSVWISSEGPGGSTKNHGQR
jgi:hypothetical protein